MMIIIARQLGNPSGRYDEHSSKSFPSVRNQGLIVQEKSRQMTEGDADWLNNTPTKALLTILVDSSSTSSNMEPAHNTTKYFVPNLR
jgi:hypothetical protein